MNYQQFADKTYAQTKSQGETFVALLNEFIELDEQSAEEFAQKAHDNYWDEMQVKAEAHSDELRGN